jgi:hypothetical protein
MKHGIVFLLLSIVLSGSAFGQKRQHYVSENCFCYIDSADKNEGYIKPFTPTHANIDSAERALRIDYDSSSNMSFTMHYSSNTRYYSGYYDSVGQRVLCIYGNFKIGPGYDPLKKHASKWTVNFNLDTKTFSDYKEL